jgi:uncharacterized membrane protein
MRYKIHYHALLTHFPISFFVCAFTFQILHLFWAPICFELATNVTLLMGTIMMIPTTLTGWQTWKRNYRGAQVPLFQRKIFLAFILLGISIPLTIWREVYLGIFVEVPFGPSHWLYLAGNAILIAGAAAEGFYGGQLNHR